MSERIDMSAEAKKKFFANEFSFCVTYGFNPLLCIAEKDDEFHIRTPLGDGLTFTQEHKSQLIQSLEMVIKVLQSGAQTRLIG